MVPLALVSRTRAWAPVSTSSAAQVRHKHELEALTPALCDIATVKKTRSYLPATQHALHLLGSQIAIARRELGWTAAELAERLGVNAQLVGRVERGAPGTAVGTVFEAAVLTGVPLYGVDPADLEDLADRQRGRLALLPARTRTRSKRIEVSDDF